MDENIVGRNIAERREQLGMYQQDLAERLNVTRQAISSWETGKTEPSIGMIEKLAQVLRCKKTDLIENKVDYSVTLPNGTDISIETTVNSSGTSERWLKYQKMITQLTDEGIGELSTNEIMLLKYFRKLDEAGQVLALSDILKKSVES